MPQPQIKVQGARELRRALNRAADQDLKKALKEANREAAETVADEAQNTVPVASGTLAASIRATAGAASGAVRAGKASVRYAGIVHFGWPARGIEPRPFLYEAVDARVDEVSDVYYARVRAIAEAVEASTP